MDVCPPQDSDELKSEEEGKREEEIKVENTGEHKRGGWFDIVMGSNDSEADEEQPIQKRKCVSVKIV